MNADIRISVSFLGHRKVKKLRRLIGDRAVEHLINLWINTAQNHPCGRLNKMDAEDIALDAEWEGSPDEFVSALVKCNLLDNDKGVYILHDWEEHQPWACKAEDRKEQARKAAFVRWNRTEDDTDMQGACSEHADSNAPFLSLPNNIKPFFLSDGTEYHPDRDYLSQLSELYPLVDLQTEFNKIAGWCLSNPSNRKTRRGAKKFINSWISKSQDRAKKDSVKDKPQPPHYPTEAEILGFE